MIPSTATSEGYFDISLNYRCNLTKDTIRPKRTSDLLLSWNITVSFKVFAKVMSSYINFIAKSPVVSNIVLIPSKNYTVENPEVVKMYLTSMVAKLENARVWGSGMREQQRTYPASWFFDQYLIAYDKQN